MSFREFFTPVATLENHDSVEVPALDDVEGIVPNRDVILYGNIESGEWEGILMEGYREYRVWHLSGRSASLETLQMEVHLKELEEERIKQAMKVYVLPSENEGAEHKEELIEQALNDPEQSVVVMPESTPAEDPGRLQLQQVGVVVVASMEDAALYLSTAA